MNFKNILPDKSISLFVKNIWVFENKDKNIKTCLPFFADGFPGLMFQQTDNGLIVKPHNKIMPEIFLYGQTIKPIELEISGTYLILIFQLYPFVLRTFFNIAPQSINDNCYYLEDTVDNIAHLNQQLVSCKTVKDKIEIISKLLLLYFEKKRQNLDFEIRQGIESIIHTKGQESIRAVAEKSNLNIRTFERRFLNETGLSAKQFAKIIQFQASLEQLTIKDYTKLTDIVYQNGFSDQSHFIKVFKAFTGKTPKTFNK
ncbi:helix-turn-helix domain-containing protein [Flavobacterium sp. ZT3R25]|uniref:helix-turn-helix domain-containing protein n=1 Tax=Flavobacterium TaxID=237 RepID=UPI003A87D243